ncbi:methionine--tRNA ligase [Candidatus Woesearchaeota archaeon]|nr:methionine--tRNA ligase [Candidatus Woesearchaeota archaeon]
MKNFFISTAIAYASSKPHCGHMYEEVIADTIARWNRISGKKVHFSTGLDCHGLKIERYAEKTGKKPEDFVKDISKYFLELCKVYNISYDDFIRTTEKRHKRVVYKLINKLKSKRLIYKDFYEGLYCVDCETYYTEKELDNKNCKIHKKPTEMIKEEGYFFKMSKFKKEIIKELNKNPTFLIPKNRRKEILNRLKDELRDLSISRKNVKWGIPFPNDKNLTIFVWVEALINYLSAIDYPNKKYKEFWPAVHIIGNDIIWQHIVIWGSILKALNIKLPSVLVHGFINLNKEKMSKSLGNVIDPLDIAKKYNIDSIRYFLLREIPFGDDGDFSEEKLIDRHNNELANDLGNLVSRVLAIAEKNFKGKINKSKIDGKLPKNLNLKNIMRFMDNYELNNALNEIWKFVNYCNKHIAEEKLWEMRGKRQETHLYSLLESIRIIAILLSSFIPETSEKICRQLNIKQGNLKDVKFGLIKSYNVKKQGILFKKIEAQNIKEQVHHSIAGIMSMDKIKFEDWKKLDLRVGKIKAVKDHPDADKLYILLVSVGKGEDIQLVAGIKEHYNKQELMNKKVIVLRNLEPAVIRGEESAGMVLAAVSDKRVTLITPDKDIDIGSKVQ